MAKVTKSIDVGFGWTKFIVRNDGMEDAEIGLFPSYAQPNNNAIASLSHGQSDGNYVNVNVNGAIFAVGPDSRKFADNSSSQLLEETYFLSDKYHALYMGAIAYIEIEDHIDNLVGPP